MDKEVHMALNKERGRNTEEFDTTFPRQKISSFFFLSENLAQPRRRKVGGRTDVVNGDN